MATTRAFGLFLAVGLSGCATLVHRRPLVPSEKVQLESAIVTLPGDSTWTVARHFDEGTRGFVVESPKGKQSLLIDERDSATLGPELRQTMLALLAARAKSELLDGAAETTEIPWAPEARLGDSAIGLVVRAAQSRQSAGLLVRRVGMVGWLVFQSSADPSRTLSIRYDEWGDEDELTAEGFRENWQALLKGVELRAATAENVKAAAAADDFPKQYWPGLARRSLTLQKYSVQLRFEGAGFTEPKSFDTSGQLRVGLTDHFELSTPGMVHYSFGEYEALRRPEYRVSAGLTGYEHSPSLGNVWSTGVTFELRKRLIADSAWRAGVLGGWNHESRTGKDSFDVTAHVGLVWDPHEYFSLGLELGSASPIGAGSRIFWLGGLTTPVATFHLLVLDLGLLSAVMVSDRGKSGVVLGFASSITL